MATEPKTTKHDPEPEPDPELEVEPEAELEPDNGHPIGVYIGHGATSAWIGAQEWAVGDDGRITGRL